jgi:hypothetical protein
MRRKAGGVLGLLASLVLLAPVTAGCAGKPERTFTRPADLPTAQQVSADNSVVEVGAWGVLRMPGTGGDTGTDVIAVKVAAVDQGEAGALEDVQLLNSPGGGQSRLADAVPYFVSYDYAVLVGNRISSTPMHWLYATTDTGTDDIDTLSLPDSVEECRTPGDEDPAPARCPSAGWSRRSGSGRPGAAGHAGRQEPRSTARRAAPDPPRRPARPSPPTPPARSRPRSTPATRGRGCCSGRPRARRARRDARRPARPPRHRSSPTSLGRPARSSGEHCNGAVGRARGLPGTVSDDGHHLT